MSPVKQIIVAAPDLNRDIFRKYIYENPEDQKDFLRVLGEKGINPRDYPAVIDLGAGEGGMGWSLVKSGGWLPQNIVCVDWCQPEIKFQEGMKWVYWDLGKLVEELDNPNLPAEIKTQKHSFDVVISTNVVGDNLDLGNLHKLAKFFVRDGGFVWVR